MVPHGFFSASIVFDIDKPGSHNKILSLLRSIKISAVGLSMHEHLTERDEKILSSVIREYILTAEPVSSRKISRKPGLELSPATIRNVMADLEEMGLLHQPHTSAGRIPTQQGFRLYVDSIVDSRQLPLHQQEAIRKKYQKTSPDLISLLQETSKILSDFSNVTGVVLAPKIMDMAFKRIDFILLKPCRILAVFVSQSGLVHKKVIEIDEEALTQDDLEKSSRYLNSILSGLTLREVRGKILEEMEKERIVYDRMLCRSLEMGKSALSDEVDFEIFVQGQTNFLEYPDFGSLEKMKAVLRALEEKSFLVSILDRALENEGIRIYIGAENELPEMEDCSFVLSAYSAENNVLGSLGVVGPTRMNYFNIIPVVDFIAHVVSDCLNEKYIRG